MATLVDMQGCVRDALDDRFTIANWRFAVEAAVGHKRGAGDPAETLQHVVILASLQPRRTAQPGG